MQNDTDTKTTGPLAGLFSAAPGTCILCGDTSAEIICPECEAKNEEANQRKLAAEEQERRERQAAAFRDKVGNYADTIMDRLPDTSARRAAAEYYVGGKAGLTISGPGDTGKTRSAVWIAQKEVEAGRWVEFRQCGELRQEIVHHARHGEFKAGVRSLFGCDLLILDDFGNHELTRTAEEFFLSLLERRTNHGKRTFVTTQYTTAQLKPLFNTAQMADAFLRRIGRQFATVVNTADNTIHPWK